MSTVFGLAVLVGLVGVLTNLALGLWARSAADTAAADAARRIATAPPARRTAAARAEVLRQAQDSLGRFGRRVHLRAVDMGDTVAVRLTAPAVPLLPRLVTGGPLVPAVDRWTVVRREER